MSTKKSPTHRDLFLLYFIVFIGAVLRFYGFFEMSFTHDELSALHRLDYPSISKLIKEGVMNDGHPPGIQVFLYYWTALFGKNEQIVKLPFLLFGVGSIVLSYLLSKAWYNNTVALLVATCVATLQLPIMYSQMARPYVSGLFFSLLMVYFWTKLLFEHKRRMTISVVGFVIAAAFCCYNHHFSLLFTLIVGTTGFFFLNKRIVKVYLLSIATIAILYIPNLPIILHQLMQKGGLSWLHKPDYTFIIEHIKYIFHFHPLVYTTVSVLFVAGFFQNRLRKISKFQIISLCWFLLPVTIGVLYSIFVKPVVQHSVLIFSFPFLLIFLFSFFRPTSFGNKVLMVVLLMVVNISTLVWSRKHYEIFYNLPFQQFSILTSDFLKSHDNDNVTIIFNKNTNYINHYFSKHNPEVDYISLSKGGFGPVEFRQLVNNETTKYLIAGDLPPDYVSLAREIYPYLVSKDFGITYEYYILSKTKPDNVKSKVDDILYSKTIDFEKKANNDEHVNCLVRETRDNHFCSLDSTMEWGPSFDTALSDITSTRHIFVDTRIEFKTNDRKKGLLVSSISCNDTTQIWKDVPINRFYDSTRSGEWQKAYHSMRLTNTFDHNSELKNCKIEFFFWNINKKRIMLDNFSVRFRDGNEQVYGLIENMD